MTSLDSCLKSYFYNLYTSILYYETTTTCFNFRVYLLLWLELGPRNVGGFLFENYSSTYFSLHLGSSKYYIKLKFESEHIFCVGKPSVLSSFAFWVLMDKNPLVGDWVYLEWNTRKERFDSKLITVLCG